MHLRMEFDSGVGPTCLGPKVLLGSKFLSSFFFDPQFFGPKLFFPQNYFDQNYFSPKIFWTKTFWIHNFLGTKFLCIQIIFDFQADFSWLNLNTKQFLIEINLVDNIYIPSASLAYDCSPRSFLLLTQFDRSRIGGQDVQDSQPG